MPVEESSASSVKTIRVLEDPRSVKQRVCARHFVFLLLGLLIPALATQMIVVNANQVAFKQAPERPLPGSCVSRDVLGVPCPGCGLTRSTVYFMHGEWEKSFQMHHLGWFVLLLIVIQVPYRLWKLAGIRQGRWKTDKWEIAMGVVFLVSLGLNHACGLALQALN